VSLLELLDLIGELAGRQPRVILDDWRPGDQKYYVSDTTSFERATGWRPSTSVRSGLEQLAEWLGRRRVLTGVREAAAGAGR
jgi:CDP-paratose 2-epimerase